MTGAPGSFERNLKCPSVLCGKALDTIIDLHVGDGYCAGPAESLTVVKKYLSSRSGLEFVGEIDEKTDIHLGVERTRSPEGIAMKPEAKCFE